MPETQNKKALSIIAAGGILVGEGVNAGKIALVRRRRYPGEIGLPKGKLQDGEDLSTAALREVREETGYDAEIVRYAGTTHYRVKDRAKSVAYFIMRLARDSKQGLLDNDEIEAVEWKFPNHAEQELTHLEEKRLVASIFAPSGHLSAIGVAWRWIRRFIASPSRDRLSSYLSVAWSDLDWEVQSGGPLTVTEPWAQAASALLLCAEAHLTEWRIDPGWEAALSAHRAILQNPRNPKRLRNAATVLKREAEKIEGWRGSAIKDLICKPDGNLMKFDQIESTRIIDALALRDGHTQNTWYKIRRRRRHLLKLFLLVWFAVGLCVVLSYCGVLPGFLASGADVSTAVLFGVLGASVSVAQNLLASDISARIPEQQVSSFAVWTRPGIGAVAALVVLALLNANHQVRFVSGLEINTAIIVIFSFIAGYSERFIVGTLDKVSQSALGSRPD